MIVDITGRIRSVQTVTGLKPYLYYTVLCSDTRDIKTKMQTKFQLKFNDNMNLELRGRVNEFYDVVLVVIDSTHRKMFVLEWLKMCSENRGFYLEKKYVSSSIVKSFPDKTESKFVRWSPNDFENMSVGIIANTVW